MTVELIDGVQVLKTDMIMTTAIAGVLLILGYFIRSRVKLFERLCIPAAVIGGFILAFLLAFLRSANILQVEMDTSLQLPFMLAFFTCVGFGGSFKLLKAGGRLLIVYLVGTWLLAVVQAAVGISLAKVLGIQPVLGLMAGTVSLVGGHGNAAAFGPVAEAAGVSGATTVAVASATYGLVMGSLLGGPVGDWLIKRNKVKIETNEEGLQKVDSQEVQTPISSTLFLHHLSLIFVFMAFGTVFSALVGLLNLKNFAIPSYVGAMFLAILFRNINDKHQLFEFDARIIDLITDIGLGFFLTMAIMTLKVWELVDLALPLIVILLVQTVVLFFFVVLLLFPALKKNYDAGVLSGGFMGWGLGIAATAVVCMSAICEKYDLRSTKAFVIAPLCGAVFVDVFAIPTIITCISMFS
ncbi:sodium/glutamate symporter [Vaginisenegalia massiliensis]|uniref:sodium/glutamate symporter n=1 Tax=Vaginisenegalia massiliensis TaxID=2058294 RepID=UPI000F533A30|nr:sodium/glutamate symporter [Vaginisenegalia massiliensis]